MNKIPSFQKNHNTLMPGLHFSTLQQGVTTYDLRFKKPNAGDFISPKALHSIEHMLATVLRGSERGDDIIYFGPMGCRTGFYLLTVNISYIEALSLLKNALSECLLLANVPGAEKIECGNYLEHDLQDAKRECKEYLSVLNGLTDEEIAQEISKQEGEK